MRIRNPGSNYIEFDCTKMRDDEAGFTSAVDWNTLRIGPENGFKEEKSKTIKQIRITFMTTEDILNKYNLGFRGSGKKDYLIKCLNPEHDDKTLAYELTR